LGPWARQERVPQQQLVPECCAKVCVSQNWLSRPGANRSYLVSNGYFEEEVHRAATTDFESSAHGSRSRLGTDFSRGTCLQWANRLGAFHAWAVGSYKTLSYCCSCFLGRPKGPSANRGRFTIARRKLVGLSEGQGGGANGNRWTVQCLPAAGLVLCIAKLQILPEKENHLGPSPGWDNFYISVRNRRIRGRRHFLSLVLKGENIADSMLHLAEEKTKKKTVCRFH